MALVPLSPTRDTIPADKLEKVRENKNEHSNHSYGATNHQIGLRRVLFISEGRLARGGLIAARWCLLEPDRIGLAGNLSTFEVGLAPVTLSVYGV